MAWFSPFDPANSHITSTNQAGGTIPQNRAQATPVLNRAFIPSPTYLLLIAIKPKVSPVG